jgi:prepilin-type processing-associated H-X9-DG protein
MPWRTNARAVSGRSLWLCPANRRRSNGRNLFHYCLNERVNGTGADSQPVRLASIARPSALVWLFDTKNLPAVGPAGYIHTNLHAAGANLSFLDGHVARFRNARYWDFSANQARTNAPDIEWVP